MRNLITTDEIKRFLRHKMVNVGQILQSGLGFPVYPPLFLRYQPKFLVRKLESQMVLCYTMLTSRWVDTQFAVKQNMETYRSGHNELDSKSSCPQGHVGSNPTVSASSETPLTAPFPAYAENCAGRGVSSLPNRTPFAGLRFGGDERRRKLSPTMEAKHSPQAVFSCLWAFFVPVYWEKCYVKWEGPELT